MEHYLIPIIQEEPINIILQVGKNDVKNSPSWAVLNNHLKLKALVKDSLPTCSFMSTAKLPIDDGKAFRLESAWSSRRSNIFLTTGFLKNFRKKSKNLPVIDQLNINSICRHTASIGNKARWFAS